MIEQLKNLSPIITFGFGTIQKQINAGQPVTVWLNTIYNQEAYTFTLAAAGAVVTKISNYEYSVSYTAAGSYTISLAVNSTNKTISLVSNILTVTVV
jgi:hypothetical protein